MQKPPPPGPMRRRSPPPRTLSASICAAATTRSPRTRSYRSARRTTTPALSQRSGTNAPDAALFVFSDDIDWAREHLDTAGLPAVFLPRGEAVADLAFMQLCRGFVLSNSTYSWWAQYLAPAPDKQTWAPDKWYAHTKKTALYQDGWQLIKASPSGEAVAAGD